MVDFHLGQLSIPCEGVPDFLQRRANRDFRRRLDGGIFLNLPIRRQFFEAIHWALCVGGSRKQSEKQ